MPPEWRRRMGWSTVYQELGLLQPVCTCRGDNWVTVWLELAISLASAPAGGWWEGRHEASPVQQHEAVRFIARTRKQQWVTCPVSVGCDSVRCLSPSWEDLLLGKGLGLLISALPLPLAMRSGPLYVMLLASFGPHSWAVFTNPGGK